MAALTQKEVKSDILNDLTGYKLRRGYYIAAQLFAETFADQGVTPIQFAIMNIIAVDDALSQKEIAANIGSSPQVIVPLVRDLEKRKLVVRIRSEADRRYHHLSLTEKGEQLLAYLNDTIPIVETRLLAGLTKEERKTLQRLLYKLVQVHAA